MVHSGALWNDVFLKFKLWRKLWKQGENLLHLMLFETMFWNLELVSKFWNYGTIDGAFWHYFKRSSWSLSCRENFKSKEAKWCTLALFETMFCKLEMLKARGNKWWILTVFETMFWKLELLKKAKSKEAKCCILTLFEEYGRNFKGS